MRWAVVLLALAVLVPSVATPVAGQSTKRLSENAQMPAVAVARTEDGKLVGSTATISVSASTNGTGRVFLDTQPLTGADMQGSARIAARVASSLTGYALEEHDFHFVVRSESPIISGPSAGSVMAMAATVALENLHRDGGNRSWSLSEDVLMTGTISPDGTIGPVGGIVKKAEAAKNAGAELFMVPEGQGVVRPREVVDGEVKAGEPVNVSKYCKNQLGITCREVGSLEDAVRLSTGFSFQQPAVGDPPSTAEYEQTLGPLADRLLERASSYQQTRQRLEDAGLAANQEQTVEKVLDEAGKWHRRAERLVDRQDYYSAASRAFSAGINARYASLLLSYYESGRSQDFVERAIENASANVTSAREQARRANVSGMQDLYTVGAAQARVSDGEQRLQLARQQVNESNPTRALRAAARAIERAGTVTWWLEIDDAIGEGPALPSTPQAIADDLLSLADEIVAYSTQVRGGQQPQSAVAELKKAKRDQERGFHAAAALEASQAQVLATLSLEVRGTVPDSKIGQARELAQQAIQTARSRGVQPLLPIAYFEFATVQDARPGALQFYRFAQTLAGLTGVLAEQTEPTPTTFVGAFEPPHSQATQRSVMVGWFILGSFSTAVLALFASAGRKPRGPLS